MQLEELLKRIETTPEQIQFAEVIAFIDTHYDYTPCTFTNGELRNEAGTNEGSCKVFAFAKKNKLGAAPTLALFCQFYRVDVLGKPHGTDHANIRNFMAHGWDGIQFDGEALTCRPA